MRADLAFLAAAKDPFAVLPADLPSFRGEVAPAAAPHAGFPAASEPLPGLADRAEPSAARPLRRVSRRRKVALVGAAALGVFWLHGLRERQHSQSYASVPAPAMTRTARSFTSLTPHEQRIVDLAQDVTEDLEVEAPRLPEPVATEGPAAGEPTPQRSSAPEARGRVLVLDDLTTAVDARAVNQLRARLLERAFQVVGDEVEPAPDAVELLAGARHALGLGRAEEPETQAALQGFLDQTADLAALILVSRAEDEGEHLYRVFVRGAARPGGASSAGAVLDAALGTRE
jgi:hypothetical protein